MARFLWLLTPVTLFNLGDSSQVYRKSRELCIILATPTYTTVGDHPRSRRKKQLMEFESTCFEDTVRRRKIVGVVCIPLKNLKLRGLTETA